MTQQKVIYIRCQKLLNHQLKTNKKYTIVKVFSGGLSGAFVAKVKDRKTQKEYVLKYSSFFIANSALRELLGMCALLGLSGFPQLQDYGVGCLPKS